MEEKLSVFTYAKDAFKSAYGAEMKEAGRKFFERLKNTYGLGETLDAIDIVIEQYSDAVTAIHKIEGVLYNRKTTRKIFFEEKAQ